MTNQNESKKPLYINVETPEKFEALAATTMDTTQRIAKRINKLFSGVFVDYYGAAVYYVPGNGNVAQEQFMVELHFKPLQAGAVSESDKRVRAFKPIEEGTATSDIVANLKSIYGNIRTSAKFQITEDAAQILSEFMFPQLNIDPFNVNSYNGVKAEYQDNPQYGQSPAMVKITSLSLTKLIRKIYGSKNEDGKRVEFGIIPYGPVSPNVNGTMMQNNANWRLVIMQVETDKTFDLATEFGIIPASNGSNGPIVTGIM